MKRVVSILPLENPWFSRKLLWQTYQALGACLKPYNALDNLKTWQGNLGCSKPRGCLTNTSYFIKPFKTALLMSIWNSLKPLKTT